MAATEQPRKIFYIVYLFLPKMQWFKPLNFFQLNTAYIEYFAQKYEDAISNSDSSIQPFFSRDQECR